MKKNYPIDFSEKEVLFKLNELFLELSNETELQTTEKKNYIYNKIELGQRYLQFISNQEAQKVMEEQSTLLNKLILSNARTSKIARSLSIILIFLSILSFTTAVYVVKKNVKQVRNQNEMFIKQFGIDEKRNQILQTIIDSKNINNDSIEK